jgi:hypothetical protein
MELPAPLSSLSSSSISGLRVTPMAGTCSKSGEIFNHRDSEASYFY